MPARRQRTKRSDGRFTRTLTYTDQTTGKRKRLFVYGSTQREVNEQLRQARLRLDAGQPVKDASRTLSEWLSQWRTTTLLASDRKDATKALYASLLRTHVSDQLGATRLDRLRASDISSMLLGMKQAGKAPSTIRSAYAAIRSALDDAVTDGLLAVNPVTKVKRPRVPRREAPCLSPSEVVALLDGASAFRYAEVLRLILGTGLRRGEVLALRWENVHLDRAELDVRGSLVRVNGELSVSEAKTDRSWRTVSLSAPMVALLQARKAAQARERLRAVNLWREASYVFTTEAGEPVDPRNLLRLVQVAAKQVNLTGIGVHTLRHTYGTTALLSGVPLHVVSRNMGHSSVAITGDIYGHVSDDASRDAADVVSRALGL